MSVQVRCVMVLAMVGLLSGCGQKGPLYREAPPVAVPTVDQSEQDSARKSTEATTQP